MAKPTTYSDPFAAQSTSSDAAIAVKICTSVNWSAVIQEVLPVVEKVGSKLLQSLRSANGLKSVTGSLSTCVPCCSGISTDLTNYDGQHGGTDKDSFIDYPNPFSDVNQAPNTKTMASRQTRRASVLSRLGKSRQSSRVGSQIYAPTAFDRSSVPISSPLAK